HSITDTQRDLQTLPQWVCWYAKHEGERVTKPPINPRIPVNRSLESRFASPTHPATWGTYAQAQRMSRFYAGIGFMFAYTDPFCGIDLDKCCDPHSGVIAPWAAAIITALKSYT